jgi:hypothetical protein
LAVVPVAAAEKDAQRATNALVEVGVVPQPE